MECQTAARLARIEAKIEQITDLVAEVAHDALETSAAVVQLVEVHKRMLDETYDLRRRLGAPGYAPDWRQDVHGAC